MDFPTVFFNRPNGDLYDLHAPDAEGNPIGGIIFPGPESTEPSPPKTYP